MLFLSSPLLWAVFQGLICVSQQKPQATPNGGDLNSTRDKASDIKTNLKEKESIGKPSGTSLKTQEVTHNSATLFLPSTKGGELFYKDDKSSISDWIGQKVEAGQDSIVLRGLMPSTHYTVQWSDKAGKSVKVNIETKGQASDPPSWFTIGTQNFHVSIQARNWVAARDYCVTLGADLAQPSALDALGTYMLDNGYQSNFYWLGGSDVVQKGAWCWVNGEVIIRGWFQGQPNDISANGYGRPADCLAMWPRHGANSLHDEPCIYPFPYICQRH